ncbi:hypothetical protein IV203_019397 [Nitzschia inconspicua]|uniref:Uncharacterized protein n=1 Tax=Nitzschia inconspicua TaxID=303405 RepID=A0A9K3Q490_9STRA|nr:hypothetical protein IV203_019397 [Nitzschia inconspicua]
MSSSTSNLRCLFVMVGLAILVERCSSFRQPMIHDLQIPPKACKSRSRGDFFRDTLAVASTVILAPLITAPTVAFAASAQKSVGIMVSPVSHTFITRNGSVAKPIRENDATRYFTNAKVVYLLEGKDAAPGVLATEVVDLTTKRKAERGAGVTPGKVETLKYGSANAVADAARKLPEGDVLLVGPIPSEGTALDGKLLADTATALGTFVGGKTGGGVISVLLDGPRENIKFEESGYPTSELFWFSLP